MTVGRTANGTILPQAINLSHATGLIERILQTEDEGLLVSLGVHVSHNYYINKIYVNDPENLRYMFENLLPTQREEVPDIKDDQVLQLAHNHLARLNDDLMRLHARLAERLQRIDAIKEKANG